MPYTTKQRQAVLQALARQKRPVAAPELADTLRQAGEPRGPRDGLPPIGAPGGNGPGP